MDEKWVHLSSSIRVQPSFWIKVVTVRPKEVRVAVESPGVDAEKCLLRQCQHTLPSMEDDDDLLLL